MMRRLNAEDKNRYTPTQEGSGFTLRLGDVFVFEVFLDVPHRGFSQRLVTTLRLGRFGRTTSSFITQ